MKYKLLIILFAVPIITHASVFGDIKNWFSSLSSGLKLGATVSQPFSGGTGIGSTTAGNVGKYLKVSDDSPFTYTFDTPSGSGGSTTTINSVDGPTFFFTNGTGLSISSSSNTFTFTNSAPNFNTTTTISNGGGLSITNGGVGATTLTLALGGGAAQACGGTDKVSSISATGTITCTTDTGGGGSNTTTTISGLSGDIIFATSSDTNLHLRISTSSGQVLFTPAWDGTLADDRIASAATWNGKQNNLSFPLAYGSTTHIGFPIPYASTTGVQADLGGLYVTSINGMNGVISGLNLYNTTTSINGLTGAITGANLFNTSTTINGSAGAFTGVNLYNTTTSINGMTGAITGLNIYNSTTTLTQGNGISLNLVGNDYTITNSAPNYNTTTSINGMTGAITGLNIYNTTTTINGATGTLTFATTTGVQITLDGSTFTFTNTAPNFNTTTSINGLTGAITGLNLYNSTTSILAGTGISVDVPTGAVTITNTAPNYNTTTSINGLTGAITGVNLFNTSTTINGVAGAFNGVNLYNTTTTLTQGTGITLNLVGNNYTVTNAAPNYNTTTSINGMTGAITGLNLYNATTTVFGLTGNITVSTSTTNNNWSISSSSQDLVFNYPYNLDKIRGLATTTGLLIQATGDENAYQMVSTSSLGLASIGAYTTTTINGMSGTITGLNLYNTTTSINGMAGAITGLNIYNTTTTLSAGTGISVSNGGIGATLVTNTAPNFNTTTSINGLTGALTGLNIYNTTTTILAGNGISVDNPTGSVTIGVSTSTGSGLLFSNGLKLGLGGNATQTCSGTDRVSSITATGTITCAAGGGGTPGGSDAQIQFNNGGNFAGNAGLTFTSSTNSITMGTTTVTGGITQNIIQTEGLLNGLIYASSSVTNNTTLANTGFYFNYSQVDGDIDPGAETGIKFVANMTSANSGASAGNVDGTSFISTFTNTGAAVNQWNVVNYNGTYNPGPNSTGDTVTLGNFNFTLGSGNLGTGNGLVFNAPDTSSGGTFSTAFNALDIKALGGYTALHIEGTGDNTIIAAKTSFGANTAPATQGGNVSISTAGISPLTGVAGTVMPISAFLTNRSGGTSVANDLYVFDTSANSVSTSTVASSTLVACVAQTAVANANLMRCAFSGQVSIAATGTVAVGDRLCTSVTAGKAASCNNNPTFGAVIGRATAAHSGAASAIKAIIGIQ